MATQALITHGTLATTDFPSDEANMMVQSSTLTPAKEKREYKSSVTKGGIQAVQYRTATAKLALDSYLTQLAGFAVQEIGTDVATCANLTAIGTAAGIVIADADMFFEDPVISGTVDEAIKFSMTVAVYPDIA
jgi:hypothetical protein